jgi:hypothetical protein
MKPGSITNCLRNRVTTSGYAKTGLIFAAALLLSACYESDVRVLNYGDSAGIAGQYYCQETDNSRPSETVTITESVRGSGQTIDYIYAFSGGGRFRFSEMDSGLFLGQTFRGHQGWGRREHDARLGYAFFDMNGSVGFSVYEASFSAHAEDIGQMLERHNAQFKQKPQLKRPTFTLAGTPDDLFNFFNEHSRHMLKETVICTRQD